MRVLKGFLLLVFINSVLSDNVLEITRCITHHDSVIVAEITAAANSTSVGPTVTSRSLLTCLNRCLYDSVYGGVLYMRQLSTNNCILMIDDGEASLLVLQGEESDYPFETLTGQLVAFRDRAAGIARDPCGDSSISCATDAKCYNLCEVGDSTSVYPYCIVDNEDCNLAEEYTNIRHYFTSSYADDIDEGAFQQVIYHKRKSDSHIRVIFSTSFSGQQDSHDCCKSFSVMFNGNQCQDPAPIRRISYSSQAGELIKAGTIDGTCYGIGSGDVIVKLVVEDCHPSGTGDPMIGWKNSRHLIIMEIIPKPTVLADKACPGLSVFNYQYSANLTGEVLTTTEGDSIFNMEYLKAEPNTALRIKFQSDLASLTSGTDVSDCAKWKIMIDGNECNYPADVVVYPGTIGFTTYTRKIHQTYTIEAICKDMPAGILSVDVVTAKCVSLDGNPSWSAGWRTGMRMHIEEVRSHTSYSLDAVRANNGRLLKNPFQNLQFYSSVSSSTVSNGVVHTFSYTKHNTYTALRLTASGNHRNVKAGEGALCTRWYFSINSDECTNPGPIEGIHYFNSGIDMDAPMQVTGVCYDIPSGSNAIAYMNGLCEGYTVMGAPRTGWGSTFYIIAEEIVLEKERVCTADSPSNCITGDTAAAAAAAAAAATGEP